MFLGGLAQVDSHSKEDLKINMILMEMYLQAQQGIRDGKIYDKKLHLLHHILMMNIQIILVTLNLRLSMKRNKVRLVQSSRVVTSNAQKHFNPPKSHKTIVWTSWIKIILIQTHLFINPFQQMVAVLILNLFALRLTHLLLHFNLYLYIRTLLLTMMDYLAISSLSPRSGSTVKLCRWRPSHLRFPIAEMFIRHLHQNSFSSKP